MNGENESNQRNIENDGNKINNIEEKINTATNQLKENGKPNSNSGNQSNEEEKNNEEKISEEDQEMLIRKVKQETLIKKFSQKMAYLNAMKKKYDDLLNNIKENWKKNKLNFEQFYQNENIYQSINNIVSIPCIILNQDKIIFAFNFLCNYFSFLKDNLKEIPLNIMLHAYNIYNNNIFSINPNITNINQNDSDNYDLIGDKLFYYLFKELLPEKEIENSQFSPAYNCMYKYFSEYLFNIGYNKKFITHFLERDDLDFQNYLYFSDFTFQSLIYCNDDFIKQNDYNYLIIKNFTLKINYYLNNSEEYIKANKNLYIKNSKILVDTYFNKIFGGLTRMIDIYEQKNLENELENFCFCLYRSFEILLKQQKLELRIVGISHFSEIVNLYKNNIDYLKHYYNDYERVYEYTKRKLLKFIKKINIFDLIFGENIHEAIIERSYDILSFLYKNKSFSPEQIALLWKISQSKYQSIGNSIIALFGKLLPEFSKEDCNSILVIVSNMNYNEVNEITLKLLENFFISEERHEKLLNILYKYSNELSYYEGLSSSIIIKSRNILVKLLFNKKYANDLHQCIKNCLFNLDNNYLLNTHRTIFLEIMNEFIISNKSQNTNEIFNLINENIKNFGELILFLDKKYSMFNIIMNNLFYMKKIFIFLIEESIKFKKKINEGNFDFDSLLNIDKLILEYKEYEQKYNVIEDECKMDLESENIVSVNDNIDNKNLNNVSYLFPKNRSDIGNYFKLILNDFIIYFKNKLLKEKISLSDDEIINNIFSQFEFSLEKNTYQNIITKLIDIIFTLHQIGNFYIKRNIIDILYNLFVDNSIFKSEKEIFYNHIKNIINLQINGFHLYNLLKEEDIEYLCLHKITSNEIINLSYPAYEALNLYLIYINERNGNIKYSHSTNKFEEIKKINFLIGFKTLLKFYIRSKDPKIFAKSITTLTNILEVSSIDMLNRNYILNELFSLLKDYKIKIKEKSQNSIEKIAFRRIIRLISIVNKTKVSKNLYNKNEPNNYFNLHFKNQIHFLKNSEDNILLKVFKGSTIKELKDEIIDKLCKEQNNIASFNEIMNYPLGQITTLDELKNEIKGKELINLIYKTQILKNEFTLADYNLIPNETILIINGDNPNGQQEFKMNEEQLKDSYSQIRVVFNDKFSEEVMKEALYKHKGDIQNTIIYMTDEENIKNLLNDMENKKKNEPIKKEELLCLEEDKFNILLDILYEGDNSVNDTIWNLFEEIKFPNVFIMKSIGPEFDKIFEENNINKKILVLKIINSVIFDNENYCKNNKLTKNIKNQWLNRFMNNENFIRKILTILSQFKIDDNNQINYSQIISILVNWFLKIFSKIKDLIKNKNDNKIDESGSNFNIIIDNEESKNSDNSNIENNKNEETYGEFEIEENEEINFLNILTKNQFVKLFYNILGIVLKFNKLEIKTAKKEIIKYIYSILLDYLQIIPNNVIEFLEEENKLKINENILLLSKEKDIIKSTFDFIKNLLENININNQNKDNSINQNEDNIDIQCNLLKCYYPELNSEEIYNEEFYELYNYLLNFEMIKSDKIPIDKIISKILDKIYEYYVNSKNINKNDNTNKQKLAKLKEKLPYSLYILCSFHIFYSEILENELEKKFKENKDIISILYDCLFKIENNNDNIFYLFDNNKLRENAFHFLSIIITKNKKYFDIILPKIIINHQNILPKKNGLPLTFPLRNFANEKFIGLKNFGATCYLNSLFQQMFMIPTFNKDLFSFNISSENEDDLVYSTIYNMQLSFINLKKTYMSFYPPINFIKSFKTAFNGGPINLGIQQDTDEFLSILCDELEKEAKKYGRENFLENSFKGKITNEIVSREKDYPYYSQTEEPFYRITLDIKGHNKLEDALDAYIKGEILDGDNKYYVEKYKKKISIKKRTSIKKIGNQIIIHLKRFEFDFVTFQNNKLNDYLKFPLKINFKKWTRAFIRTNEVNEGENNENNIISEEEKENLNNDKMNYELTGILIHSGASLQSGHYYSFIKDQETNKWYKFNDSKISEYDIDKDLEKECFGNIDNKKNQYGKGAYLLFYTKKECIDSYKNYEKNIKVNENILRQVEKENIEFMKLKFYIDDSYKNFLSQFIICSSNYLKNKQINTEKDNNDLMLIRKDTLQEIKIYEKLVSLLKGNKENNIDINDKEINILPENIEQIYEKCKTEVIYVEKNQQKDKKKIKNKVTTKDIIKFFYYYTFGIIYQYKDQDTKLNEILMLLQQLIEKNQKYSLCIVKLMEKNIDIFIDLLFKYGYIDKENNGINKTINNLYKHLFHYVYLFEIYKYGRIINEVFHVFVKDEKGKLIVEKEYKSLFLRMLEKLFYKNLEKCRKEYSRDYIFLDILNSIICSYLEASLVSSKYLSTITSILSNNNIEIFKSKTNPNFKKPTNDINSFYLSIFCNTILRSITPGMIKSNKVSPYFLCSNNAYHENIDLSSCPKIPENWGQYLEQFFIRIVLYFGSNEPAKILYHTSFYDESISLLIMKNINHFLKNNYTYTTGLEIYFSKVCKIFDLNDGLNEKRVTALFELDVKNKNEETLFDYYSRLKDQCPFVSILGIYCIALEMREHQIIYEYFKANKNKLIWIKDFYAMATVNSQDKNSAFYKNIEQIDKYYNNLFEVIENEFINKLEI